MADIYLIVDHTQGQRSSIIFRCGNDERIQDILQRNAKVNLEDCYLTCDGKLTNSNSLLQPNKVYHVIPRLSGGKGGFGSMLRAIGAQIEKTTNHEACRDLSGRRMRDVNNEKQLKEWLAKKVENEKQKEEERKARIAKKRAMPNHKFDDPVYEQQRMKVIENQEDAFQMGFRKTSSKSQASAAAGSESQIKKRKTGTDSCSASKSKKSAEWLGLDMEGLSDLDSDESESESAAAMEGTASSSACSDTDSKDGILKLKQEVISSDTSATCSSEDTSVAKDSKCGILNLHSSDSCSTNDSSSTEDNKSTNLQENVIQNRTNGLEKDNKMQHGLLSALSDVPAKCENDSEISSSAQTEEQQKVVTLENCSSAAELENLGLDQLKTELMSRGMKCGGTLQERAQRLFSVKGLTQDQIDPSLLAKPGKGGKKKK